MKEYTHEKTIGLDNFLKNVSKFTEEGWEPIWVTFKEGDDENRPTYFIILEKEM